MSTAAIIVAVVSFVLGALLALLTIPVLVWLERRIAGLTQDRLGPNRTNVFGFRFGGVVQSFADVVKLLLKEEYYPSHIKNGRWLFMLAPVITFVAALLAFMAIPFADTIILDGESLRVSALPIDYGVFWYLAIGAVGVLGVIFVDGSHITNTHYLVLFVPALWLLVMSFHLDLVS
jgi:NADH-quinone oxidoreductase subunit H